MNNLTDEEMKHISEGIARDKARIEELQAERDKYRAFVNMIFEDEGTGCGCCGEWRPNSFKEQARELLESVQ